MKTTDADYRRHVLLVADDVAKIRKCDVYRLLACLHENRPGFAVWLKNERRDLVREITECCRDLAEEESASLAC